MLMGRGVTGVMSVLIRFVYPSSSLNGLWHLQNSQRSAAIPNAPSSSFPVPDSVAVVAAMAAAVAAVVVVMMVVVSV